jgi:iron complex outermembrane receptor protein
VTAGGVPTCGTPTAPIAGCVPLNLLDPGHVSKGAIDYLTFTSINSGLNEEHVSQAQINGKIVELPNHGDVSFALGGDYRFERGSSTTDPLTATGDTTGNASAPTAGSYHASEGFAELSIVPVSGLEYIKWAELDAAGRAYDYSTFGSGVTGKLSALVRTVGGLAFRGTYGTGFRAPNIGELFQGQTDNFVNLPDACNTNGGKIMLTGMTKTQCEAQGVASNATFTLPQQRAKIGGNPNLTPEKAKNITVGGVYEPIAGLDFTLDYWHIQIDNAIQTLSAATISAQCYQGGIKSFCDQIQRDPNTSVITYIYDLTQNVGALTTSGLDFSASYQWGDSKLGSFRHAVEGTYLFKYNVDTGTVDPTSGQEQIIHGRNFYDLGVNPDWKVNALTFWGHPSGLGAGANFRFINGFQECESDNCNKAANLRRHVSAYGTGDLFVNYSFKSQEGTTKITGGVNNFVNAKPPAIYNGAALNADESAYDFIGAQAYVRLSQVF